MNQQWKTSELVRLFGFAGGLVVCGVFSYWVFTASSVGALLVPIPFAVLCGVVCVRPWQRLLPAILLICLTWYAALSVAVRWSGYGRDVKGIYLGGLVGGLGVGLSMAVCRGRGGWVRISAMTSAIGLVSARPFATPMTEFDWIFCFAMWQVPVGMCLYVSVRLASWRGETDPQYPERLLQ